MLSKTTVNVIRYTKITNCVNRKQCNITNVIIMICSVNIFEIEQGLTFSAKHLYADNFSRQASDHSAIIDNHAYKHSVVALSVKTEYNLTSSANNWTVTSAGTRSKMSSYARTVVRECCKGDDESQWERGKFDPRYPKTPQPMDTKICVGTYFGDIYHHAKLCPNRLRGFWVAGVKFPPLPLTFIVALATLSHYCASV